MRQNSTLFPNKTSKLNCLDNTLRVLCQSYLWLNHRCFQFFNIEYEKFVQNGTLKHKTSIYTCPKFDFSV